MSDLLHTKSFNKLTVAEIADHAKLEAGAFFKRFGSKKGALLVLWENYCNECATEIQRFNNNLPSNMAPLENVCSDISAKLEALQIKHFSANRAINENFMEDLKVAEPTKIAFMHSVQMMRLVQKKYLDAALISDAGAFAAAQILLTINYNYTIKAMPGLPKDTNLRHKLIGKFIADCLAL